MLENCNAILKDGHFGLSGGFHSREYVQVRLVLAHEEYVKEIAQMLGSQFLSEKVCTIVGGTSGGIALAKYITSFLKSKGLQVRLVIARIIDGNVMFFGRSHISPGENVIIVDDVLRPPSGQAIGQMIAKIENEFKGNVKSVGTVIDRTIDEPDYARDGRIRVMSLAKVDFPIYAVTTCPMCNNGLPFEDMSKADTDPILLLFSLKEEDRPTLADLLKYVYESWGDEKLLGIISNNNRGERGIKRLRESAKQSVSVEYALELQALTNKLEELNVYENNELKSKVPQVSRRTLGSIDKCRKKVEENIENLKSRYRRAIIKIDFALVSQTLDEVQRHWRDPSE